MNNEKMPRHLTSKYSNTLNIVSSRLAYINLLILIFSILLQKNYLFPEATSYTPISHLHKNNMTLYVFK